MFTPTEASGIGALGAALIAFLRGRLSTARAWLDCLADAGRTSAAVFAVIFGALVFGEFINLSGLPFEIVAFIDGLNLSAFWAVIAVCIVCIVLGTVFEALGILVLIIPVFMPTLIDLNVNLVWFGILVVLVTNLGLITPPVGMNVFTVKNMLPDISLTDIFRGVLPYTLALVLALVLVLFIPGIALLLPDLMLDDPL